MIRKFIVACVLILFVSSATAFANTWESSDYEKGIIRVTGVGAGPHNCDKQDSFYKTFARQVARMDALRCLVENLIAFSVDKSTTVGDLGIDLIRTAINPDDNVFKFLETNARQVGKARFEDGVCEVDMELILPTDWKVKIK